VVVLVLAIGDVRAMRDLSPSPAPPDAPLVVVIVPARNEEPRIAGCLRSLLASEWPNLRVICVDDRSEDGTYAAASLGDPRLTLLKASELPRGWLGKNHANWQGVAAAGDAPYLLFTDADTVHAPGALPAAMALLQEKRADLVTLLTDLRCETFWERALLTHVIAAIIGVYPMRKVNDPRSSVAIANGQYMLVRREAYDAAGGHAAIRDRVADDMELARAFKSRGARIHAAGGRAFVAVRMYASLREIWWGFTKNASAGVGGPVAALFGAVFVGAAASPFYLWPFLGGWQLGLALATCGVALLQRFVVFGAAFSVPRRWALLLPLALPMLIGIVLHSAFRQLSGKGPRWKGREYPDAR
jgi:chlorobactene glucosyltransferase